uniref:Protein tyrosine phosphatase n=1 Tax=Panagrolaimus sp. ES5 TaxID=591445 RepID=A0AC34GYA4_9BILA
MAEEGHHVVVDQQKAFLEALQNVKKVPYQNAWKLLQAAQENQPHPSVAFEREILKPDQIATNRYKSVPCNDYHRVTINGSYIHANYIKNAAGKNVMIATQGPLESTLYDFWKMVIQERSPIIVMLCEVIEDKFDVEKQEMIATQKSFGYWPTEITTPIQAKHLDIFAERIQEIVFIIGTKREKIILSELKIVDRRTKKIIHKIDHFQYLNWKDQSVPETTDPIMHLYKHYILPAMKKKGGGPIIVHCSAGIGRTGVFVGALFCLDLFLHRQLVSMPRAITMLRRQRGKAIQGIAQYTYLHLLLFELIENATGKSLTDLKKKFELILLKCKPKD